MLPSSPAEGHSFALKSTSAEGLQHIRAVEERALQLPQLDLITEHILHAGLYSRSITIPAGAAVTGVFVTTPTLLIVTGDVLIYADVGLPPIHVQGNQIITASANRKQAFIANSETKLTMIFATNAKTVDEAESQFTNETHLLASRLDPARNITIITGE